MLLCIAQTSSETTGSWSILVCTASVYRVHKRKPALYLSVTKHTEAPVSMWRWVCFNNTPNGYLVSEPMATSQSNRAGYWWIVNTVNINGLMSVREWIISQTNSSQSNTISDYRPPTITFWRSKLKAVCWKYSSFSNFWQVISHHSLLNAAVILTRCWCILRADDKGWYFLHLDVYPGGVFTVIDLIIQN